MSVKSKPYYWLVCDRCLVTSTEGSDYSAWDELDTAEESARDSDWLINDDGSHFCDDCTTWDDETDKRINKPPLAAVGVPADQEAHRDWTGDA